MGWGDGFKKGTKKVRKKVVEGSGILCLKDKHFSLSSLFC